MKKLLFVLATTASIAMVSCSVDTNEVDGRDGTNRSEVEDVSHNEPQVDTTVLQDSSTADVGIDSASVIPAPEVVAPEVSTRTK